MSYARFQPMIEAARPRAALWRLGLGVVCVFAIAGLWVMGVILLVSLRTGLTFDETAGMIPFMAETPSGAALFLFLYAGLGYATLVAGRILHSRGPRSLTGPPARALRHFAVATVATWGVMAALALVTAGIEDPVIRNLDVATWLKWLPLGLFVVAVQSGSEEVFFRGYLQSQMAGRFRSPWFWLVLPALGFGALHILPTLPPATVLTYAGAAALFGLLAGDLTARTGSIGAAWGFHFANNSLAILFIASDSSISGLGLYRSGIDMTEWMTLSPLVLIDILALAVIWALIRRLLSA